MTNPEILKKAIEKAVKGGWDELRDFKLAWQNFNKSLDYSAWIEEDAAGGIELLWGDSYGVYSKTLNDIIFSHSFAKAFWNKDINHSYQGGWIKDWQYHLQQYALAEDRLKYIERFL